MLKVYLRLVEDAVLLQTIPHQRRREIMLGLTANMKDLFEMFVQFLRLHTNLADENVRIRHGDSMIPPYIQQYVLGDDFFSKNNSHLKKWLSFQIK